MLSRKAMYVHQYSVHRQLLQYKSVQNYRALTIVSLNICVIIWLF